MKQQPACNVDETSWRQGEQTKASWLWVVVTALVTVFHIVPSRSGAIARQLLGETYTGVVGSDRAPGKETALPPSSSLWNGT